MFTNTNLFNMTIQELRTQSQGKINIFVKKLNGRFKEYVSDAYLSRQLLLRMESVYSNWSKGFTKPPSTHIVNIAYEAALEIFEKNLENYCDASCNGHHVSQSFAELFSD